MHRQCLVWSLTKQPRCILLFHVVLQFVFAYLLPSCAWLTSPAETLEFFWYAAMKKKLKYTSLSLVVSA